MNKKKRFNTVTLFKILSFSFFVGIGIFSAAYELKYYGDISILFFIYTMTTLAVSIPLHVILHETGHLLTGLLSGYEFIMFRLFNSVWIKTDDGLSKRQESIPGVMGQALMVPPANSQTEQSPYLLYHLGGIILNTLTALAFFLFARSLADPFTRFFFYFSGVLAFFFAISNLLPFKGTDGYNILNYLKNPQQEDEILAMLHLYQDMVEGRSFNDILERYPFETPQDFANPNTVTFYSLEASAALENKNFEKAREIYAVLWKNRNQLVDAHKAEVSMSYLFALLLTEPSHPHVENILESPFYKAYRKVKQADSYRVFAAKAFYLDENEEKALTWLEKGEKEIPLAPTITDEKLEEQLYEYLRNELTKP